MSNKEKKEFNINESVFAEEVFDIIELTTNDIDLLADAFDLIAEVCESIDNPHVVFDNEPVAEWVH